MLNLSHWTFRLNRLYLLLPYFDGLPTQSSAYTHTQLYLYIYYVEWNVPNNNVPIECVHRIRSETKRLNCSVLRNNGKRLKVWQNDRSNEFRDSWKLFSLCTIFRSPNFIEIQTFLVCVFVCKSVFKNERQRVCRNALNFPISNIEPMCMNAMYTNMKSVRSCTCFHI